MNPNQNPIQNQQFEVVIDGAPQPTAYETQESAQKIADELKARNPRQSVTVRPKGSADGGQGPQGAQPHTEEQDPNVLAERSRKGER